MWKLISKWKKKDQCPEYNNLFRVKPVKISRLKQGLSAVRIFPSFSSFLHRKLHWASKLKNEPNSKKQNLPAVSFARRIRFPMKSASGKTGNAAAQWTSPHPRPSVWAKRAPRALSCKKPRTLQILLMEDLALPRSLSISPREDAPERTHPRTLPLCHLHLRFRGLRGSSWRFFLHRLFCFCKILGGKRKKRKRKKKKRKKKKVQFSQIHTFESSS